MYFLVGSNQILRQWDQLLTAVDQEYKHIHNDMRKAYYRFIDCVQPQSPNLSTRDSKFLFDDKKIKLLLPYFTTKDLLTDMGAELYNTSEASRRAGLVSVEQALNEIKEKLPEVHEIFNKVIHTVFYNRCYDSGGGSVSSLIGVIWCCNRKTWSIQDVLEFLVHELTHNLIFLDEYYHVHYNDLNEVVKNENYVISAILHKKQYLDKVFNSIIVAHEIIKLRKKIGEPADPKAHPPTEILEEHTLLAIRETLKMLKEKPLATQRVYELLKRVRYNLEDKGEHDVFSNL